MPPVTVRFVGGEPEREYLSPAGVAIYLGVSARTVYNWIRDGRLKASRPGPKLLLISRTQLAEFLDTKNSRPRPSPAPAALPAAVPKSSPDPKSKTRRK
jgi:excisionase family DNA binding protein